MRREVVIFRQDDVKAARLTHCRVQLDIGAAARHVGRDRDPSRLPGAGYDFGLAVIVSRIEDHGKEPRPRQQCPDVLRRVDRACAYQNGPALR